MLTLKLLRKFGRGLNLTRFRNFEKEDELNHQVDDFQRTEGQNVTKNSLLGKSLTRKKIKFGTSFLIISPKKESAIQENT